MQKVSHSSLLRTYLYSPCQLSPCLTCDLELAMEKEGRGSKERE